MHMPDMPTDDKNASNHCTSVIIRPNKVNLLASVQETRQDAAFPIYYVL